MGIVRTFDEERAILDRALDNADGIDIICQSYRHAVALRQRCNHFRKTDREANIEIYPEDHPMRGRSVYDKLELVIPAKGDPLDNTLIIRPRLVVKYEIRERPPQDATKGD